VTEEETRQRILDAAARLFSEQGYNGATTRAIADLAQVNEVTLFRHFGTKMNLFQEMIKRSSALPGLASTLEDHMTGSYRHDLLVLTTYMLRQLKARRREILMFLAEAERQPEMIEMASFIPSQQRELIGGYLKQQIAQGRIREVDPDLAAQALLGMVMAYCIGLNMLPEEMSSLPVEEVAALFVDLFIEGIRLAD
jgi:AcrR family transcriptional regulator